MDSLAASALAGRAFRMGSSVDPRPGHGRCVMTAVAFAAALCATDATAVFIITEPWVRPSTDSRSAEAFMELSSTESARLVGVRCDAAASIEMRAPGSSPAPVKAIDLPAGKPVVLAPRAYRLALGGLAQPLRLGDHVAIVLIVMTADGTGQEIRVNAEVRRNSPTYDHQHGHKH